MRKYYRMVLNYESPIGEIEYRRTKNNASIRDKILDINWDRNTFMPPEILECEFSLTEESKYLDILKVDHLTWEGILINSNVLNVFKLFRLQEYRIATLKIHQSNNEKLNFKLDYDLIHFHSNGEEFIHSVIYQRTSKGTGIIETFKVSYQEFIRSEINIQIRDKIARKISIIHLNYIKQKLPKGFFDLFYNTFLFNSEFIISEELHYALNGFSGISFKEGPYLFEE